MKRKEETGLEVYNTSMDLDAPSQACGRSGMIITQGDRDLIKIFTQETLQAFRHEAVKTDEELITRLEEYFTTVEHTGQIPTIEEMLLTTGMTEAVARGMLNGRIQGLQGSTNTRHILQAGYDFIKAIDAKLVISGKMNFLAYCFRAKNYYGMVDKVEHVITPNAEDQIDLDVDELSRKYGIGETVGADSSIRKEPRGKVDNYRSTTPDGGKPKQKKKKPADSEDFDDFLS